MMRALGLMVGLLILTALAFPLPAGTPPSVGLRAASSSAPSAWDRPALAANAQTIQLDDQHRNLKLDQSTDYVLKCSGAVQATWGLVVWGGHNVVLDGCDYVNGSASGAAQFKDQTGTLWVHDVHFAGAQLTEGIDLQEPAPARVVLRDVLIDELHGSYQSNHADCVQSWSGPQVFLVDGFTCTSDYQGFFLLPNQWDSATNPTAWDFRNVDVTDNGYSFWLGDLNEPSIPTWHVQDVYATPLAVWNGTGQPDAWAGASAGPTPGGGRFVWAVSGGAYGVDDPSPLRVLAGER